jgi:hypothetical protein
MGDGLLFQFSRLNKMDREQTKVEKKANLSSMFVENYAWLRLCVREVQNVSPNSVEKPQWIHRMSRDVENLSPKIVER